MICKKCGTYFATQVACKAHRCFPSNEQENIDEQELLDEINGGQVRITASSPDDAIQIVDNRAARTKNFPERTNSEKTYF